MKTEIKAIAIMLIYILAGLIMSYVMYQNSDECFFILGFPMGIGLLWCIIETFKLLVEDLKKKTNNMKKVFYIMLAVALVSCTSDIEEVQQITQQNVQRIIRVSNEGEPFEYWLNQAHYNSDGQEVVMSVNSGTQITLSAMVSVVNGVSIIPNFQVYQDGAPINLTQITPSFFWYQVL